MTPAQLQAWAQSVKATVDQFGAHGIDIDYEAETNAQWYVPGLGPFMPCIAAFSYETFAV